MMVSFVMTPENYLLQMTCIQLNVRRTLFRVEFLAHFKSFNVDIILCPPAPGPAPVHLTTKYWNYTSFFNLVDYPAAVFPTGLVVEKSDTSDTEHEFMSDIDREVWKDCGSLGFWLGWHRS